jgi:2-dehydropantoate 2-reductase
VRIAVFGAGGVGGYFGGRLAVAGADVHLIARGAHLEALRERGLRVRSVRGDFEASVPATDDPEEVGAVDAVFVCVKAYDTEEAAAQLGPLLGRETMVISLQNGIDNAERLGAAVGDERVLGGAAYVFAELVEPGVIEHRGGPSTIAFGELDGTSTERAGRLLEPCRAAGIAERVARHIRARLWEKFAFICAQAGMTATTRRPLGDIRASAPAWSMFRQLLTEVTSLAAAEGVQLAGDVVDRLVGFAETLEPAALSSLHDDLVAGRRMELDALHGTAVRRAAERGLELPACRAVLAVLDPWARRTAPVGATSS